MEKKTLTFPGSASVELDYENKLIHFSEYGEHVFKISFDECKVIYETSTKIKTDE